MLGTFQVHVLKVPTELRMWECLGLEAKLKQRPRLQKDVSGTTSPVESAVQFSVSKNKISSTRPLKSLVPRSQADQQDNLSEAGDQSTDSGSRQTSLGSGQLYTGHPCDYITSLLSTGCLTYEM